MAGFVIAFDPLVGYPMSKFPSSFEPWEEMLPTIPVIVIFDLLPLTAFPEGDDLRKHREHTTRESSWTRLSMLSTVSSAEIVGRDSNSVVM